MSGILYPVSPKKIQALKDKMEKLGLRDSDFLESFVRSRGSGGQNVNKVSTCAVITYLPTRLEVKCDRERSQALNRFLAKRQLVEKIESLKLGTQSPQALEWEKIRRNKDRRSRRARHIEKK